MGLVTEIVPDGKLMDSAGELAAALAAASPTSLLHTKRLLCESAAEEIDRELKRAVKENARIRCTEDFREGLAAFLEKRAPKWSGR